VKEYTPDDLDYWDNIAGKAASKYMEACMQKEEFDTVKSAFVEAEKAKIRALKPEASDAELTSRAKGSKVYQDFIREHVQKYNESNKARIAYQNAERRWSTARSGLTYRGREIERLS